MKLTMHLYITDPPAFAMGKIDDVLRLESKVLDYMEGRWIHVGEIEIDFGDLDLTEAKRQAIEMLDKKIEEKREEFAKILETLQAKRDSLTAIEHKAEEDDD